MEKELDSFNLMITYDVLTDVVNAGVHYTIKAKDNSGMVKNDNLNLDSSNAMVQKIKDHILNAINTKEAL